MRRIVVGTDFSETSEHAVKQAIQIARFVGADVVLVHSLPMTQTQLDAAERSFGRPELFRDLYTLGMEKIHEQLAAEHDRLDGQGVVVSQLLADAPEAEGICDSAEQLSADLVVVGSHGRGAVERMLLGSVSERIVRGYEGNVLIARNSAGACGFERIVVPADYSDRTERSLAIAVQLVADGGVIDIVHSTHLPPNLVRYWDEGGTGVVSLMSTMSEHANRAGERMRDKYRADRYEIAHHELSGPPRVVVPDYIENSGAPLAIVGSHGRRGVKRWLLGSVAEGIVRRSPSSVLVVR